jgi:hypothetical protein
MLPLGKNSTENPNQE